VKSTRPLLTVVSTALIITSAAAEYPERPIRFVVPAAAGGGPDVLARLLAGELSRQMGQQVVVDNRPGGSGSIGIGMVVQAAPDGYTIGYGNILNIAIVRSVLPNLSYDPERDLQMVALTGTTPNLLAASLALPTNSVAELIDFAKKNPDKLFYGYAGTGSSNHLSGELLKLMTGMHMVPVPFKAAQQGFTEMMAGRVQLMFETMASMLPHVKAGKLRGLGVTSLKRLSAIPDLPTLAETVPGYEVTAWGGTVAPAKVPKFVVNRLNKEINIALSNPVVREKFAVLGYEVVGGTPEHFAQHVRKETVKWADVIKRSGVKID